MSRDSSARCGRHASTATQSAAGAILTSDHQRGEEVNEIYRRVSARIWADLKVRKLSPIAPCGQGLWIHMLTGEQTGVVPGLFRIGEAAFAEQLGWPLDAFRSAFAEVEREGLAKADWLARLVWIPKALKHSPPASPNVVRHWRITLNLLPECQLRDEAFRGMEAFLEGIGKAFVAAFREGSGKPFGKDPENLSGRFQETFGESVSSKQLAVSSKQEALSAEPTLPAEDSVSDPRKAKGTTDDADRVFGFWVEVMGKNARTERSDKRMRAIRKRLESGRTPEEIMGAIRGCRSDPFNMGGNDRRRKFNDIELICRDAPRFEAFLEMAGREPCPLGPDGLALMPNRQGGPVSGHDPLSRARSGAAVIRIDNAEFEKPGGKVMLPTGGD